MIPTSYRLINKSNVDNFHRHIVEQPLLVLAEYVALPISASTHSTTSSCRIRTTISINSCVSFFVGTSPSARRRSRALSCATLGTRRGPGDRRPEAERPDSREVEGCEMRLMYVEMHAGSGRTWKAGGAS
ncbi:hypothetical protein V8C44DRAFT_337231 [Trichoderma aethiopicum]